MRPACSKVRIQPGWTWGIWTQIKLIQICPPEKY
jgi:hypothetical protein